MFINGQVIKTPYDSFPEYAPDWRSQVAQAWAGCVEDTMLPADIAQDEWIIAHRDYFMHAGKASLTTNTVWMHELVHNWHESGEINSIPVRLEPLLLTEVSFAIIAADLLGDFYGDNGPKLIQLYERLYYDCRNKDGSYATTSYRRSWLAMPATMEFNEDTPLSVIYKMAACIGGYAGLSLANQTLVGNGPRPTVELQIDMLSHNQRSILWRRSLIDRISNMDLMAGQRNELDLMRLRHEEKGQDGQINKIFAAYMDLLKLFSPTLYKDVLPEEAQETLEQQYRSKIQSSQVIEARMSGTSETSDIIDAHERMFSQFEEKMAKALPRDKGAAAGPSATK